MNAVVVVVVLGAVALGFASTQKRNEHIEDGTEPNPAEQKAHGCITLVLVGVALWVAWFIASMGFEGAP